MKHITSSEIWPPPENWTEIIILWDDVLNGPRYPIKEILNWVDNVPGDGYHLHGYNSTEGFSFRFQNPKDAVHFKLRWVSSF
jgi:hypothetical protein